jgi:hypothetical protein
MAMAKNFITYISFRRLLAVNLLFSWIMACLLSPSLVFAQGAANLDANGAKEEIATFEEGDKAATFSEDEAATFDPESTAAKVSPFLHSEQYQPSVYFPERQKRSVTSHQCMRILPFAALVFLALVTARFLRRHRHKTVFAGGSPAFEKITGISVGILFILSITAGVSHAIVYSTVKDAVVSFLGEGKEIFQTDINITPEVMQALKKKVEWAPQTGSVKVYYSKGKDGSVEAYAFVLSEKLEICGGLHKYCIKMSSKGQVEGVKILELTCDRSYAINTKAFLNQFRSINTTNAGSVKYDAVTGATLSTHLTGDVVCRAVALFDLLKGNAND